MKGISMEQYKMKLCPTKLHFLSAILFLIGMILFLTGGIKAIRTLNIKILSEDPIITKGDYVTVDARNILYGRFKGANEQNIHPVCFIQYDNLSVDPLKFYEGYVLESDGKYRAIYVSNKSELYAELAQQPSEETSPRIFIGKVTAKYSDTFIKYMTVYLPDTYEMINSNADFSVTTADCEELGIEMCDLNYERWSFLYGLALLLIGSLLFYREGSPLFKEEKSELSE